MAIINFLYSVEHMHSKRPTVLSVWQAMLSCRRCNSQLLSIDLKRFSSSKRWQSRQRSDMFTREAVVRGLKSRAAFKLLQVGFFGLWIWMACQSSHPNRSTNNIGYFGVGKRLLISSVLLKVMIGYYRLGFDNYL